MRVLAVASEMHPLVKTGGLADVVGALPGALAAHGVEVVTLLPGYPAVVRGLVGAKPVKRYPALFGGPARLVRSGGLLVLEAAHLYAREGGPYADASGADWPDNLARFAALAWVASDLAGGGAKGFAPDLLHLHDWQAALAAAYVRFEGGRVPTVVTIHNLAFQGRFEASGFARLGLPAAAFGIDGVEYFGGVGFLKAGLRFADAITSVSPTYAMEIRTPAVGMGLDGLLRERGEQLHGILNGIDREEWDPATDRLIAARYSAARPAARVRNKPAVEALFALSPGDGPIFCVVSRLTWQKGMDLLVEALDDLVAAGGRLALLGSGDRAIEGAMLAAAARHPGKIGVRIGYDEAVSHQLQAGADAILVPSRTEPCGLTQMYGLRYGCVPVVARTGGLADTVIDANEAAVAAGVATGLQFVLDDAESVRQAVRTAVALHANRDAWRAMQRAGMRADFSWGRSAGRYASLFAQVIAARG